VRSAIKKANKSNHNKNNRTNKWTSDKVSNKTIEKNLKNQAKQSNKPTKECTLAKVSRFVVLLMYCLEVKAVCSKRLNGNWITKTQHFGQEVNHTLEVVARRDSLGDVEEELERDAGLRVRGGQRVGRHAVALDAATLHLALQVLEGGLDAPIELLVPHASLGVR
jgi:hypothetical protein